jgi:hypothetical protein
MPSLVLASRCTRALSAVAVAVGTFHSGAVHAQGMSPSVDQAELVKISAYLDELVPRSSVVETRELEGDAVDCVLFWEQPSVRKLRSDGITIDEPSFEEEKSDDPELSVPSRDGVVLVEGPRLKEPCPKGSVPIRRVTVQEIAEYGSLERYLTRAYPAFDAHEYAFAQQDGTVYGNEARLNIWAPYVQTSDDFSLSQLWVGRGSFGSTLETVEAGWIKRSTHPTRLFVFFTSDSYGAIAVGDSCWNTDCGFVQVNGSVVLNGNISPVSTLGGTQTEAQYNLQKNGPSGAWSFYYNGTHVGYWPRSLFNTTGIRDQADYVQWGGEIYDYTGPDHAETDMGTPNLPFTLSDLGNFGNVAYQSRLRAHPGTTTWAEANPWISRNNAQCYDIGSFWDAGTPRRYIYFGGPGRSGVCGP